MILSAFIKRWVVDKLGEAKNPTFRWNTPDNTPDSVIQVMHLLSGMLMKRGENPKEFVGIFHEDDDKNPMVKGDWWMLVNKKRPADSLHYNADDNTWNSSLGAFKFEPLNRNELKIALQNWG
jgi:hypothetical protein